MSALPPDERSRDAADPVATVLADPVAERLAERFLAGDDRLAALLRDLPPFTAPEKVTLPAVAVPDCAVPRLVWQVVLSPLHVESCACVDERLVLQAESSTM